MEGLTFTEGPVEDSAPPRSPWHFPTEPGPAKAAYQRACRAVILAVLEHGPCSLAAARVAVGLYPPPGVDGRCAGGVMKALEREGRIRWDSWGCSPLRTHHRGAAGVWVLVTAGGP